jgi:hypothetical protein
MKAKVIRTEISRDGIIHLADHDLPPGRVNVIILYDDTKSPELSLDAKDLPLGGYQAGWIAPEDLRREAIYEKD